MSSIGEQQQATNQSSKSSLLYVKDMNPMSRNFDCEVIVLQKDGEPTSTREGDLIYRYLVADKTGSIVLSVWGELGRDIRNGDILRISGVNNKLRQGRMFISTLKSCKLKRIGQDTFQFSEKPNMSEVEHQQPPSYTNNNNSNWANNNNGYNNRQRGGYQHNNNMSHVNLSNHNSPHPHPYNSRGRHNPRASYNNHRGGRGGGNNRYRQDLDNPV